MEERKVKARETSKLFNKKMMPYVGIEALIVIMGLIWGRLISNDIIKIVGLIVLFIIYMIVFGLVAKLNDARKIMYCRILVGKEISDDPIKEGLKRIDKFGRRNLRRYRRDCGRIMYVVVKGALSLGDMMEQIPQLKKISGLYKKIVNRLYENCAKTLVTYQVGCYEEADPEQFYDLVTYFVQDGKNFILKTVKSELKEFIVGEVTSVIMVIALMAYAFTGNIIFAVLAVVSFLIDIVLAGNKDDFNILCDYIEYVQTHELDVSLKDMIVTGVKNGNKALDLTRHFVKPAGHTYSRNQNGRPSDDLLENAEYRL